MLEVTGGIYIDYGCSGIFRISEGVFIPTSVGRTSDDTKEFQEDLKAFLDKWCRPSFEDSGSTGSKDFL